MREKGMGIFRVTIVVLALTLVLVSTLNIKTAHAQAGQVTLKPSDDTYVNSYNQNSNYGGETSLEVLNEHVYYGGQNLIIADVVWLKFNLSSVPNGAVIDVATLQLYLSNVQGTSNAHVYSCTDSSWTESTLTYSNMPSYNTTSMDSLSVAVNNQWYNWSTIDAVKNALNSNAKAVTVILLEPSIQDSTSVSFQSKEAPVNLTDYSPHLTIHWSNVVPEFSTFLVLPLFMMATLLAVIVYRKRARTDGSD